MNFHNTEAKRSTFIQRVTGWIPALPAHAEKCLCPPPSPCECEGARDCDLPNDKAGYDGSNERIGQDGANVSKKVSLKILGGKKT